MRNFCKLKKKNIHIEVQKQYILETSIILFLNGRQEKMKIKKTEKKIENYYIRKEILALE